MIKNKLKVEVHLTNLFKREESRHISYTAKNVDLIISGSGNYGYFLAAKYIIDNF
jgi:3-dehydroquinate dehydratase